MNIPVDLILIVDTTSSMSSLIDSVKRFFLESVKTVSRTKNLDTRVSIIQFRDHPPEDSTFASRISLNRIKLESPECVGAIKNISAHGGGDGPESGFDGINELRNLTWNTDERSIRIGFFIGDSPIIGTEECVHSVSSHGKSNLGTNCRCGLSINDMEQILELLNVDLIGLSLGPDITKKSFEKFCNRVFSVSGSMSSVFEKMITEISEKSDKFTWARDILLPVLEKNPLDPISDYCKLLGKTSQEVYSGIELLNYFGYTEKLTA